MTLGVVIGNRNAIVLLADRRKTRPDGAGVIIHSDQEEKISFSAQGTVPYAFSAAGDWERSVLLRRELELVTARSYSELVTAFSTAVSAIEDREYEVTRTHALRSLQASLQGFSAAERKEQLRALQMSLLENETERREETTSEYFLIGRDGPWWGMTRFTDSIPSTVSEQFETIGSGSVIARNHLYAQAGMIREADDATLAWHAVNAYQVSTVTNTVGGTPDIMLFRENATRVPFDTCSVLMNLSGAYLARLISYRDCECAVKAALHGSLEDAVAPLLRIGESFNSLRAVGQRLPSWNARAVHPVYRDFLV